jgi:hypothetical protein
MWASKQHHRMIFESYRTFSEVVKYYTCMNIHKHSIYMYTHTYTYIHMYVHIYIYIYIYTYIFIDIYTYSYKYIWASPQAYRMIFESYRTLSRSCEILYMHEYTQAQYIYVYTHIYIYIHTYSHMYIWASPQAYRMIFQSYRTLPRDCEKYYTCMNIHKLITIYIHIHTHIHMYEHPHMLTGFHSNRITVSRNWDV